MKKIIKDSVCAAVLFLLFQSCTAQQATLNKEIQTEKDGIILVGHQAKSQLLKEPYSKWYVEEHNEYAMDMKAVEQLKERNINSYEIVLAMGSWCEDSHREVPRLMKILEKTDFPEKNLTIIAVDRQKKAPDDSEKNLRLEKVPTIIVMKNNKEIGRIIESPTSGWLERDLLEIIK